MTRTQHKEDKSFLREVLDILLFTAVALVVALFVRSFVFQPYYIPTSSMVPTLVPNDKIIVNELGMRFRPIRRGDVMAFRYPLDPSQNYIKRVIGLPGEQVEIREDGVYVNGQMLHEPYLDVSDRHDPFGPVTVPVGQYFTLGDNRPYSEDSRSWGFVPAENMLGKAEIIYWPLNHFGWID